MFIPFLPKVLRKGIPLLGACLSGSLAASGSPLPAYAQAQIFNGGTPATSTVALGVNQLGHLNIPSGLNSNSSRLGLSYLFPDGSWRDATSPGCFCEGWGLAVTPFGFSRVSGFANESSGTSGLTLETFTSTPTTAKSAVSLTSSTGVKITHDYGVSNSFNVFKGVVKIENTSGNQIDDVVYRRVMDWDVPLTEFAEFVTHRGVAGNLESTGGNVRFASDNGFASSDPLSPAGEILPSTNVDFVDLGTADHGSVFDFAFGAISSGESKEFEIFYGAFSDEDSALAAIPSLGLNVYSLGQSNVGGLPNNDGPTFLFGFRGMGSFVPDPPDPSSVPGPLPLLGCGAGLAWSRVLRRRIKAVRGGGIVY